jgi:mannose-6-phosphate isomerase-like protein (cupin superfamily)
MTTWHMPADEILSKLKSASGGKRSFYPLQRGTMRLSVYAPTNQDAQDPHDQDELYIVISGTGTFAKGQEQASFKPGDAIFVEAGAAHAFTNFSSDFATWVIFWGPKGGEA